MGAASATWIRRFVDCPPTRTATLHHLAAILPQLFVDVLLSPPPPLRHRQPLLSSSLSTHDMTETSATNSRSPTSATFRTTRNRSRSTANTFDDKQQLPPFPVRNTPRKRREHTCSHPRCTRRPSRPLWERRTRQIPPQDRWNFAIVESTSKFRGTYL